MKVYILLDKDGIVRCIASKEGNLHKDKLDNTDKYFVTLGGRIGDEYDPKTDTWIARPENYPVPEQSEINEKKIKTEIRAMAIQSLIDKGELPTDYEDSK